MAVAPAMSAGEFLDAGDEYQAPGTHAPVWKKTPCRMCGVGCGLLVAIANGRATAVKGDPDSPVSKGLACARGYYSVQAMYGRDRITRAKIRRGGSLVDAPISEALDLVARRISETTARYGRDSVAMYGSAQWTIADAYVAGKLFKAGLGTNNVETSSRLYAAGAMAGAQMTFGLDGFTGCYEDIDHADVFILWDSNLAETDPVLFSRMLERRRKNPAVRIVDVTTRTTRTSYAANNSLLHAPYSLVAVANAICNEIVERKWVHREFVNRHVAFKRGRNDLGHGDDRGALIEENPTSVTLEEYAAFLSDFTPERVQRLSGVPADRIRWLASVYGDRSRKVMSVWGANASCHSRGAWVNNALYNIHLLVGKIASPGNSALCTVGQPTGGNSVHGAGAQTHALPAGAVTREQERRRAASIWGVPANRISSHPGRPLLSMLRAVERGDIRFLWIQATNPMVSLPALDRYRRAAAAEDRFIVVSEAYPTATTEVADVVLPAALWFEREGIFANAERRTQHFEQMVQPPGDAMSDAWQMIEVGRRLGLSHLFPYERSRYTEQVWNEYRAFHTDGRSALAPLAALREQRGVIWPFVEGRETRWRYNAAHDPAVNRARGSFDFYGHADGRAWIWLRPHTPPPESPDNDYPFWLTTGPVLEHFGTGTLTRRIPTLHRGAPRAYAELSRHDAERLGVRSGDTIRLVTRRGSLEIQARIEHRSQPAQGSVFVPSFDAALPVQRLLSDAYCPLSGQPQSASCAVRIERVRSQAAS